MGKILNLILFFACCNFLSAQEQGKVINIRNLDINTEYADFGVSFYKDNLVLFASSKKDRELKRKDRSKNKMLYLQFYKGSIADNGQIILEGLYSKEKYNMFHESDITFSTDGKTIYFTLNNYIQDEYRNFFRKSNNKEHILNIFRATINDDGIASNIEPVPFNDKNYSVSNPELSPDGKTLYFSSNMDGGYGMNDIYKVAINEDGTYGSPENLGVEINTKYNEFFPFLSTNNTFYFTSDGHREKGYLDIYSSNYSDDTYSTPTNLNDVNSKYDDFAFVISPEKNVGYFSSSRKGKGNVDIYSFLIEPTECNQTIAGIVRNTLTNEIIANSEVKLFNDGKLFNSITTNINGEFKFNIDCETTYAINASKIDFIESEETTFTSSKVNSKNTDFILYLEPIECLQTITGIVRNEETNEILANTDVKLSNDTGFSDTIKTNKNGEFKFDIDCETAYVINASKINFIESEGTTFTSTKENSKNTDLTLYLKPIECKQTVAGIVTNKETLVPINNVAVSLFHDGIVIEKTTTQIDGLFNFNTKLDCKTAYKVVAEIENYTSKIENFKTSDNPNEENYLKLELQETDEFITYKNIKMIRTKPIYFDLNKHDIRKDAAIELDKVIRIMIKYPTIKIELKSHTDSRAPDGYNMTLSKRRANSSVAYIISQGIDSNRISGEGYGETQLVNRCSNNVKCSEAEHQKNRRTEFIVISE
ncbi:MAG: hypothetical protein COA67_08670 [Lutibacter sp.]|nr:MAG: hypothetical protein COA67_08670 [Lutibacter sp.]